MGTTDTFQVTVHHAFAVQIREPFCDVNELQNIPLRKTGGK